MDKESAYERGSAKNNHDDKENEKMGKDVINAKTFKINLYFYKFVFSPREKGWDYPEEVRHMPNMWKWKVEIWKKSSNYGYTNVIPFWRMTRFCIRQFKNAYMNWKETGNTASLQSAFCAAHSLSDFGMHLPFNLPSP